MKKELIEGNNWEKNNQTVEIKNVEENIVKYKIISTLDNDKHLIGKEKEMEKSRFCQEYTYCQRNHDINDSPL